MNTDLLPELCHYRDDGCELFPSCLHCPLSRCIYDEPRGRQRMAKALRDEEMVRLFRGGMRVEELAGRFRVSRRTVQRVLSGRRPARFHPHLTSPVEGEGCI